MVFAPPAIGKTYLCLSIADAIAKGKKLFDWEAPESRKVLYIDGEMHESDLHSKIQQLVGNEDISVRYLNGTWQRDCAIPDLSTEEGQSKVDEVIAFYEIEVIFLDNLSTLCRSGKENETQSWLPVQNWLTRLRWKGITIVLVHHAGKVKDPNTGKPRQRGTSLREIILESSIVLDRPKDYHEEEGCRFELHFAKSRGFCGNAAAPIQLKLREINGKLDWEYSLLSMKTYDRILNFFAEGTTSAVDIARELEISPQAVRKHINNAKEKGDLPQ